MIKLLLVEDEKNLGQTLVERLQKERYQVFWARSFKEAHRRIDETRFDLALLDILLPDGNGYDLALHLRQKNAATPFLFLTALGEPHDRVKGFDLGAEDYLVKPFHFRELTHRIRKILKREETGDTEVPLPGLVKIGNARIDFASLKISFAGGLKSVERLRAREGALLKLLFEKKGLVVSRDEIRRRVWKDKELENPRTIDNLVLRLRRLMKSGEENLCAIRSVRGVGYQMECP